MGSDEGHEPAKREESDIGRSGTDNPEELTYITAEEAISLYGILMDIQEAHPADFVRDWNLLESALARPQNAALYEDADVARQAATLLWGMVKNHPFIDGNKRIAHLIAFTFLDVNGYVLIATEDEQFALVMAIADEGLDVDSVDDWMRQHIVGGSS